MTGAGDRARAGGGLFWGSGVYISVLGMGLCRSVGVERVRVYVGAGGRVCALNWRAVS